jgi:2-methylcitrate dehydratase PrpD
MVIPKYKYVDIPLGEPEPEYYSDKKEMKKARMKGKVEVMKAFKKMKEMMKNGMKYESFVYDKDDHDDDHGYGDDDEHY